MRRELSVQHENKRTINNTRFRSIRFLRTLDRDEEKQFASFGEISPASKLALYHYEASKRQHEVEQAIKTEAA
jgi:hypothetical protein